MNQSFQMVSKLYCTKVENEYCQYIITYVLRQTITNTEALELLIIFNENKYLLRKTVILTSTRKNSTENYSFYD